MTTKLAYSGKKGRHPRHPFLFEIGGKVRRIYAKVRPGTATVSVTLSAEHVRHAIKNSGYGNAQQCAGALCVKDQGASFGHKFSGYVDWLYRRVYVASKNHADTNLPAECRAYSHDSKIAQLFDTKEGQKELLYRLERQGPIEIKLKPPTYVKRESGRSRGRNTGERTAKRQGHKARVEKIKAGGLLVG